MNSYRIQKSPFIHFSILVCLFSPFSQSLDPYMWSYTGFEFDLTFWQKWHFYLSLHGTCENMRYVAIPPLSLCQCEVPDLRFSSLCRLAMGVRPVYFAAMFLPYVPPTVSLTWCPLLLFFSASSTCSTYPSTSRSPCAPSQPSRNYYSCALRACPFGLLAGFVRCCHAWTLDEIALRALSSRSPGTAFALSLPNWNSICGHISLLSTCISCGSWTLTLPRCYSVCARTRRAYALFLPTVLISLAIILVISFVSIALIPSPYFNFF